MISGEPSREWQDSIHRRILSESRTAFAELCEQILDPLIEHLINSKISNDKHLCETVASDTLLKYSQNPEKYDPKKSSLFSYLRMDARGDLKNALDSETRRNKKIITFDDPDVVDAFENRNSVQENTEFLEMIEELLGESASQILEELHHEFDVTELEIIQKWIVEDDRSYTSIVTILQIEHEDLDVQRKEVKRVKDRLMKKLLRFGERKKKRKT